MIARIAVGLAAGALEIFPEAQIVVAQIGGGEIVLGGKAAIEARLGDAGPVHHLVDADGPDALAVEQLAGGGPNPVGGPERRVCGFLGFFRHLAWSDLRHELGLDTLLLTSAYQYRIAIRTGKWQHAPSSPSNPPPTPRRPFGRNNPIVVVAVIFLALLASAGLRATPGVLMLPLQKTFGWDVSVISSSAAVGIFLYGLAGPFAAAVMQRFGIRRTVLGALALMSVSTALSYFMTTPWQLFMSWGLLSGIGSGAVANVLGATIVNRWFTTNRGLVMGLLTASTATGTLIFMPGLASLVEWGGWQPVVLTVAACCAALIPLVYFLVPERPATIGLRSYGSPHDDQPAAPALGNPFVAAISNLVRAAKMPTFWFLFATFFICGFTTNGLVGTHLIAFCGDHGIFEVQAASLLALMGFFDLFGTTLSGWLTDRFDPRKLLFFYYGLRGLSLIYLPYSDFSTVSLVSRSRCSTASTGSRPCRRPCASPTKPSATRTRR